MIEFIVNGKPSPKHRARHAKSGRVYADPRTGPDEADFLAQALTELPGTRPIEGAVELTCIFHFEPPKSWNSAKRNDALWGRKHHTSKPDLDNLIKHVKDSLNKYFWVDDQQVVSVRAFKAYAPVAHTHVKIREIK